MRREELLKSKEYWLTKIQIDLFNEVEKYMDKYKLNRTQLAEKLGVSKGYISQILNGDADHRISKLVELSLAVGVVPQLSFEDMEIVVKKDSLDAVMNSYDEIENSMKTLLANGYLVSNQNMGHQETTEILGDTNIFKSLDMNGQNDYFDNCA